jgi:DNA-binding XRE family transcriptional regulator
MQTHEEMGAQWMTYAAFKAEYEREVNEEKREEMPMLDAILSVRKQAHLSQEEVARRMNVSPSVVSRLERALLTGKPSPSLRTLHKYAQAVGKRVHIALVD